jgi:hypothetical protein
MAYVYRHIRLDKNEPFYIGIGSDSKYKRANARFKGDRNNIWNKIVAKTNYQVQILFDDISWEDAIEKEKEFIALYGRKDNSTGILANMTDGGEGVVGRIVERSLESRLKQSETMKKRRLEDPEYTERHNFFLREGFKKRTFGEESLQTRKNKSDSHKLRYENGAIPFASGKTGSLSNRAKKVICTKTNKIWGSVIECAEENLMKKQYLTKLLNGTIKNNKTTFIYHEK